MLLFQWPDDVLEKQTTSLTVCRVRDGTHYVYPLWKSLLDKWFSDASCRVFIVTPFLDATRLADICSIVLRHRLTANLDSIYVHQQCDKKLQIHDVKKRALDKFEPKEQMYLEYKIYSNMIYPAKKFNAAFIGCVKGDEARVLVTSASFHGNHFGSSCMETVFYQQMTEVEFVAKFLGQINASGTRVN